VKTRFPPFFYTRQATSAMIKNGPSLGQFAFEIFLEFFGRHLKNRKLKPQIYVFFDGRSKIVH